MNVALYMQTVLTVEIYSVKVEEISQTTLCNEWSLSFEQKLLPVGIYSAQPETQTVWEEIPDDGFKDMNYQRYVMSELRTTKRDQKYKYNVRKILYVYAVQVRERLPTL